MVILGRRGGTAHPVVRDKMPDTIVWGMVGVVVAIGLVGIAYLIGRFIWAKVEPGDPDPGGREHPHRGAGAG